MNLNYLNISKLLLSHLYSTFVESTLVHVDACLLACQAKPDCNDDDAHLNRSSKNDTSLGPRDKSKSTKNDL